MQKLFIGFLIILSLASASISKIYIGSENDQVIIGIETLATNVDGAVGLDLRTFFRKNGIIVDGTEYGSVPGKTQYNFLLAGKNEDGSMLKLSRQWAYTIDEQTNQMALSGKTSIGVGYGQGGYLLYH